MTLVEYDLEPCVLVPGAQRRTERTRSRSLRSSLRARAGAAARPTQAVDLHVVGLIRAHQDRDTRRPGGSLLNSSRPSLPCRAGPPGPPRQLRAGEARIDGIAPRSSRVVVTSRAACSASAPARARRDLSTFDIDAVDALSHRKLGVPYHLLVHAYATSRTHCAAWVREPKPSLEMTVQHHAGASTAERKLGLHRVSPVLDRLLVPGRGYNSCMPVALPPIEGGLT